MEQLKPFVKVVETRDITYKKKSVFFGLITWYVQSCATHIANDMVIILKTPIRKIMIDNNGKLQEINLEIK